MAVSDTREVLDAYVRAKGRMDKAEAEGFSPRMARMKAELDAKKSRLRKAAQSKLTTGSQTEF